MKENAQLGIKTKQINASLVLDIRHFQTEFWNLDLKQFLFTRTLHCVEAVHCATLRSQIACAAVAVEFTRHD